MSVGMSKTRYYGFETGVMYIKESGVKPPKEDAGVVSSFAHPRSVKRVSCLVDGAHAFILRVSSISGLAPLKFVSQSTGFKVSFSNAMWIYSYVAVTVLIFGAIFGLISEINVGMAKSVRMSSLMSQAVSIGDVLVVCVTAGVGVYGAPKRMRNLLLYMDRINSIDTSIGAQYAAGRERKYKAVLITGMLVFLVILLDDLCLYARQASRFDRTWDVAVNNVAVTVLWFVVVMLELQFSVTALAVQRRLTAVNDALAQTARQVAASLDKKESEPLSVYTIRMAPNISLLVDSLASQDGATILQKKGDGEACLGVPPSEAIRRLSTLHGALCEVIHHVDKSYGLPLIVILLSTLLHLVVTPYFLIIELGQFASTNRTHFMILRLLWCAFHFVRLLMAVEPGHYTSMEGKRTEGLVGRLMTYSPTTGILPTRLELFARQLMLRSVSYVPMGMCTLDRPLMAAIIGAVTTYLVILIQFQT